MLRENGYCVTPKSIRQKGIYTHTLLYYIANFTSIESAYPARQSTEKHRTSESCTQTPTDVMQRASCLRKPLSFENRIGNIILVLKHVGFLISVTSRFILKTVCNGRIRLKRGGPIATMGGHDPLG